MTDNIPNLDKKLMTRSFGQAASHYDDVAHLQREIATDLLDRLDFIKLTPQTILDVGTGTGNVSRTLQQKYPKANIYSIDIALPMLQQAKKHVVKSFFKRPKQHLICADTMQLPIKNNSVDLLISNLMLQWCDDIQTVFTEFARVLKPDGALFFSTFGPDTLKELRQSWADVDQYRHVNQFTDMHDIGDSLLQAGFTHPVMDVDWVVRYYQKGMDLMHELKKLGAHNVTMQRAPTFTGKTKLQTMLNHYENYRQPQGLPATYEVIYGHALGKHLNQFLHEEGAVGIPIHQISHTK